jgi:hypothetical protein
MIKCDLGMVTVNGDMGTVISEFTCLIRGMRKSGIPKEVINWAINKGFKDDKELDAEFKSVAETIKAHRSTLKSLLELMDSIEGNTDEKHSN